MSDCPGGAAQPGRDCPLCPRLVAMRHDNRASFPEWHNAPVDSWGHADAPLLILGMALATRDMMEDLRAMGTATGGPKPFSARDRSAFLQALDQAVVRAKRVAR